MPEAVVRGTIRFFTQLHLLVVAVDTTALVVAAVEHLVVVAEQELQDKGMTVLEVREVLTTTAAETQHATFQEVAAAALAVAVAVAVAPLAVAVAVEHLWQFRGVLSHTVGAVEAVHIMVLAILAVVVAAEVAAAAVLVQEEQVQQT